MTTDFAVRVRGLGKHYQIYNRPRDRLLQSLWRGKRNFYREFWALRGLSFEVQRGETLGIIGGNGSGKSTLLQIICGTLQATEGSVDTRGRVAALLELGAGFNPDFTGRENVYLNAALLGLSRRQIDERLGAISTFADIGDFIDQPVKVYSSGMFVRLAFSVMAHVEADILVIDEALAVGDALFTQKCMRYLRQFREKGTLIFVSHDTAAVTNLCQRAILLEKGKMKGEGPAKEICELYLQDFIEERNRLFDAQAPNSPVRRRTAPADSGEEFRDQRRKWINQSNLRNDLEVFAFDPRVPSFGQRGAEIVDVSLRDEDDRPLAWVVGGEAVTLRVRARAERNISRVIIGFYLKDKLGQYLFGDNTYFTTLTQPVNLSREQEVEARFEFEMPRLPVGDYSFVTAIAEGTNEEHVQHHWIHDALLIKSHCSSVNQGLVGLPMNGIALEVVD
jgi:lipopolysaccharide transport system ATP-binding protein